MATPTDDGERLFQTGPVQFYLADPNAGGEGFLMFRGEDVTLFRHEESPDPPASPASDLLSSARNVFTGTVVDMHASRQGLEVLIDVGIPVWALITEASRRRLHLSPGQKVQASIKSVALRFLSAPSSA